jgi:hypothetical protein
MIEQLARAFEQLLKQGAPAVVSAALRRPASGCTSRMGR